MTGGPDPWDLIEAVADESTDNIWTRPLGMSEYRWEDLRDPRPWRLEQLRAMPYRDYLQTSEWKARRRVAISQARGKCQRCFTKGIVHVHHRTYANLGCESALDLEVLCPKCHRDEHGIA